MQQDGDGVRAQLAFFAEDELIEIVPNFQLRDLVNDHMLVIDAVRRGTGLPLHALPVAVPPST
jgi:hypothetical protein